MKKLSLFIFSMFMIFSAGCVTFILVASEDEEPLYEDTNVYIGDAYTVTGKIVDVDGNGIENVNVVIPDTDLSVTTDSEGYYTFDNLPNNIYALAIETPYYLFPFAMLNFIVQDENLIIEDCTGYISGGEPIYSISGRILDFDLKGVADVSLSFPGSNVSATTDDRGYYLLANLSNGKYIMTPAKPGYTFSPEERSVSIYNSKITDINYFCSLESESGEGCTVTGRIIEESGISIINAVVTLKNNGSAWNNTLIQWYSYSDLSGYYFFNNIEKGSYTLKIYKEFYTFSPISLKITIGDEQEVINDFIGIHD
ncbi:MAG: hypothetical protein HOC71_04645 [Candidatus Latescibacteria bacterium]|jgi:hypothetical protein|nr:hypothetical protein [Candidatus Latescibacterota bacterium]